MPKTRKKAVHRRFAAWLDWLKEQHGWTQENVAERLECSQVFVSLLADGKRSAGLKCALKIQELSAAWAEGPICAPEWLHRSSEKGVAA